MRPATLARNLVPLIAVLAATLARAQPPLGETFPITERPARIDSASPSCQPAWPAASLKAGVTGTTVVRVVIDEKGRVSRSEVVRPSGPSLEHRLLDYAFQAALMDVPILSGHRRAGPFDRRHHHGQLRLAIARGQRRAALTTRASVTMSLLER